MLSAKVRICDDKEVLRDIQMMGENLSFDGK
jgi:hypothetical protein